MHQGCKTRKCFVYDSVEVWRPHWTFIGSINNVISKMSMLRQKNVAVSFIRVVVNRFLLKSEREVIETRISHPYRYDDLWIIHSETLIKFVIFIILSSLRIYENFIVLSSILSVKKLFTVNTPLNRLERYLELLYCDRGD